MVFLTLLDGMMKIRNCICDNIIFQQGPDGGAGSPGNPGVPGTKVNMNLCVKQCNE